MANPSRQKITAEQVADATTKRRAFIQSLARHAAQELASQMLAACGD